MVDHVSIDIYTWTLPLFVGKSFGCPGQKKTSILFEYDSMFLATAEPAAPNWPKITTQAFAELVGSWVQVRHVQQLGAGGCGTVKLSNQGPKYVQIMSNGY